MSLFKLLITFVQNVQKIIKTFDKMQKSLKEANNREGTN